MPLLLSITGLNPPVAAPAPSPNVTLSPPVVKLLPEESRACSVTVAVLPETIVVGTTEMADRLAEAPALTVVMLLKVMVPSPVWEIVPAPTPVGV